MSHTDTNQMNFENRRLRGERDEARSEVSRLKKEIASANVELEAKKIQIKEQEKRMQQLKKTIQVQSDQIAGPREFNTPHRNRAGAQYHPPAYAQAPPVFAQPAAHLSSTVNLHEKSSSPQKRLIRSISTRGTLTARRTDSHVAFNEPVERARKAFQAGSLAQTPLGQKPRQSDALAVIQRQNSHGPRPKIGNVDAAVQYRHGAAQASNWRGTGVGNQAKAELVGDMGALVVQRDDDSTEIAWPSEFSQFFKLTEDWARNYTNVPEKCVEKEVPKGLIDALARHSELSVVQPLLASGSTRYFLIAKLINSFVTSDLFRPQTRKGYSDSFDDKFNDLRHQIQPDLPSHLRYALMLAIADTAKEMHAKNDYRKFVEEQVEEKIRVLWDRLSFLFAPGVVETQAWDDLKHIFQEAFRIGGLMMCTPLSYSFSYPTVRANSYFNPTCMLNRDISFKGDPMTLKRQGLRIRLGITPVVVITSFLGPAITPQTVHFANVLLMH